MNVSQVRLTRLGRVVVALVAIAVALMAWRHGQASQRASVCATPGVLVPSWCLSVVADDPRFARWEDGSTSAVVDGVAYRAWPCDESYVLVVRGGVEPMC